MYPFVVRQPEMRDLISYMAYVCYDSRGELTSQDIVLCGRKFGTCNFFLQWFEPLCSASEPDPAVLQAPQRWNLIKNTSSSEELLWLVSFQISSFTLYTDKRKIFAAFSPFEIPASNVTPPSYHCGKQAICHLFLCDLKQFLLLFQCSTGRGQDIPN